MAVTAGAITASSVARLTTLSEADDRFRYSAEEIRRTQIAALDERFQERRGAIKLLDHLATEAGITKVGSLDDIVPLLFPHTAYKSYPLTALLDGRWDRLATWLGAISPHPPTTIDPSGIVDLDAWIARLGEQGIFLSCSSGTTGTPALVPSSRRDLAWLEVDSVTPFTWGTGIVPAQDRRLFMLAAVASIAKNDTILASAAAAFGTPDDPMFRLPMEPITIGSLTKMVALRGKVAEGTATPAEAARLQRTLQERAEALEQAMTATAEAAIVQRRDKLFLMGYWPSQYQVARLVRAMGYGGEDFNPDNCIQVAGGLKRAKLPPDHKDFVCETFNISPDRRFEAYGMQELNSTLPRCRQGHRFHVPPWLVPLVLNRDGDAQLPPDGGEVEGRAAFFDLSLDGRWGGIISGDRISLDYRPCACGNTSPSIRDDVARYADLEGDDAFSRARIVDNDIKGLV
jgi:hypothetical protein